MLKPYARLFMYVDSAAQHVSLYSSTRVYRILNISTPLRIEMVHFICSSLSDWHLEKL